MVFAAQLGIVVLMSGLDQARALALGDVAALELSRPQLGMVFAGGLLVGTPLAFVGPRVLLDGRSVGSALRDSLNALWNFKRPVVAYTAIIAFAIFGLLWMPLMLLLLLPFATYVSYAAYRDIFHGASR